MVRILDPGPFLEVLETGRSVRDQTVRLDEYNKYVEQTIIYDRSYHILMSIMRDITEEEAERARKERVSKETIEITDNVINKQMRIVQELSLIHI